MTKEEMLELSGYLEGLATNPIGHHFHFDTDGKEITGAIYTDSNIDEFDERSRELILTGK